MTRLEYMKLAPGRRRDVREHLAATRRQLNELQSSATLQDFQPAPWLGVGWAPTVDGTCRAPNHHGVDLSCNNGKLLHQVTITQAASGSGQLRPGTYDKDELFKTCTAPVSRCWGCGRACRRKSMFCTTCTLFVNHQNVELRLRQRSKARTLAKRLAASSNYVDGGAGI